MDSSNRSPTSQMSDQWKMFGEKIPRAQLLICLILIIACIVMLVLHDSNREYWMICLSSTVGYIMPSPTLQLKSSNKPESA